MPRRRAIRPFRRLVDQAGEPDAGEEAAVRGEGIRARVTDRPVAEADGVRNDRGEVRLEPAPVVDLDRPRGVHSESVELAGTRALDRASSAVSDRSACS